MISSSEEAMPPEILDVLPGTGEQGVVHWESPQEQVSQVTINRPDKVPLLVIMHQTFPS